MADRRLHRMLQTYAPGCFAAWEVRYPSRRLTRGVSWSEFRLETDVVRTADDVVSRRVGGERLAAHERRSLVADVRETRHQLEVLDDGPVCIEIEVVVSPHPRGRAGRIHDDVLMLHRGDVAPVEGGRDGTDQVSERRVRLPMRVSHFGAYLTVTDTSGIVENRRSRQRGHIEGMRVVDHRIQAERSRTV